MSQNELDEILNEIRSRGNTDNNPKVSKSDVDFAMESFSKKKDDSPKEEKPAEKPLFDDIEITDTKADDTLEAPTPAIKNEPALDDDLLLAIKNEPVQEYFEEEPPKKNKKKIIIAIIAVIVAVAIGVGLYFGVFARDKDTDPAKPSVTQSQKKKEKAEPVDLVLNPLTGEAGYDEAALTQRPVAVVVENEFSSSGVRPQWGIDEADIVLEGESECSTRALLFWADFNKVPEKVGPTRSARPPFIRFSQLFDSVFIHAGLSRSKGDYVGADEVFRNEGVDHINLLSYATDGVYMGRDSSRTSVIEHTGYLNGTNTAKMLKEANIRTELNDSRFTALSFNKEAQDIGTNDGTYAYFKWSSNCPDYLEVTYDAENKVYLSDHFDSSSTGETANCKWTNCIFLFDNTTYVVKENYKGVGNSETYCNYSLDGGDGVILSNGKSVNIKWGVSNGKLWIKNADTDEDITLNPGKSYIGYGSSNHGGSISLTKESE